MLHGKTGLVMGVANKRSIAWGAAKELFAKGASIIFTYQSERFKPKLEKLLEQLEAKEGQTISTVQCDVTNKEEVEKVMAHCREKTEGLNFLFHSIAYAPRDALTGRFVDISWEDYQTSLQISSYSLVAVVRAAEELLEKGQGSVVTMTYLGSTRAVPNYNVMGVAKAALEASVRYLAYELGEKGIRVNAISAGPVRTLAAAGIPGFSKMYQEFAEKSFLKKNLEAEEVGSVALFLASELSRAITGEVLFVDGGFNKLGM